VPQQQASAPQGPTATFVAYNRTVVLRSGAIILNQPGNGQPIGRANGETQLQASARSTDGSWYQVVLQDGTFGFVSRQWMAR
jgi:hypothetical protein